jgi:hypothetical protein
MHYGIPELEPGDGPDDLGPIDPWLEGRRDVVRVNSHTMSFDSARKPSEPQVVVSEPWPEIARVGGGG